MQTILAFVTAAALLAQSSAMPTNEVSIYTNDVFVVYSHILQARAVQVCGYPVVPLYRAASDVLSDRIFTTDANEIEAALATGQYVREAVIASVYSNTTGPSVPDAIPLYKLHSVGKTDHFITTSWSEVETAVNTDGYSYQGITAYVYADAEAGCATKPLYRQYNPTTEDHQYSLTQPESTGVNGKNGYFYEGITAHVFPPQ